MMRCKLFKWILNWGNIISGSWVGYLDRFQLGGFIIRWVNELMW